uniref:Uncharacterized protein n=1 Tax=Anguilla anguilla TaxID=7936 RepID=A0A0E9TPS0_ANGAN
MGDFLKTGKWAVSPEQQKIQKYLRCTCPMRMLHLLMLQIG